MNFKKTAFVILLAIWLLVVGLWDITDIELGGGYLKNWRGIFASEWGKGCTSFFSECWGDVKIPGADAESFVYVGGTYAKDKNYIYYNPPRSDTIKIQDPDFATFKGLSDTYAKDKNYVYYGVDKITIADLATFEVFSMSSFADTRGLYARDKKNIYFEGQGIEGADRKTFIVPGLTPCRGCAGRYYDAKDKNYMYYAGKRVNELTNR